MKKLMIVGLVAACACGAEAGILGNAIAALQGKAAGVKVVSAQTSATVVDVESVNLMELNEKEFKQVVVSAKTEKVRRSLLSKLRREVYEWKAPKLLKPVRSATLAVLDGLKEADKWLANHWEKKILPTLEDAWRAIKKVFGK